MSRFPDTTTKDPSVGVIRIPPAARAWSIAWLPLSVRLANTLRRLNCYRLADIHGMSYTRLAKVKNCGRKTVQELEALVARLQAGELYAVAVKASLVEGKEDLEQSIDNLKLSMRAYTCLDLAHILTLRGLCLKTENELLAKHHFGRKLLDEIKVMLASKGLRLGMRPSELPASKPPAPPLEMHQDILDRSFDELELSVRAYNCLKFATGMRTVRDLCRKTETELLAIEKLGHKSLDEIKQVLAALGLRLGEGSAEPSSSRIFIPQSAHGWAVESLPVSARLAGVLRRKDCRVLGDLHGRSFDDLQAAKNCGRHTILELRELIRRVQAGEFDQTNLSLEAGGLRRLTRLIDEGLDRLPLQKRNILRLRMGSDGHRPLTLEEVGKQYNLTRERIRQITHSAMQQIGQSGGPIIGEMLNQLADWCVSNICPLTSELLSLWLGAESTTCRYALAFYVRMLNELRSDIPAWPEGQRPGGPLMGRPAEILRRLKHALRMHIALIPLAEAFGQLRRAGKPPNLHVHEFLEAIKRDDALTIDFTTPDRPHIRPATIRARDLAQYVLTHSDHPLTPEEIIAQGGRLLGESFSPPSPFTLTNGLIRAEGFYLLGRRTYGLRKHFGLPTTMWPTIRADIYQWLQQANRPVSTVEIINDHKFAWASLTNAAETAQVLREDNRFVDLGRFLFALTEWGIAEREYVADLIPKVLAQAGRPLNAPEICKQLQRFRSMSPTSMPLFLRKHPEVRGYGFGYYGLKSWGEGVKPFLVSESLLVKRIISHSERPITFGRLCEILEIPLSGSLADRLWQTVRALPKVSAQPDIQAAGTWLLYQRHNLEQALFVILTAAGRPLLPGEVQGELNDRFGMAFRDKSLLAIKTSLRQSRRFIRNAKGKYLVDAHLDQYDFDVASISQGCHDILAGSNAGIGCEDLLERLEAAGIDVENLSPQLLAAWLRSDERFEEIGSSHSQWVLAKSQVE